MPQMSPMNWLTLCMLFLISMSILKSIFSMSQKNMNQNLNYKKITQNNMKW